MKTLLSAAAIVTSIVLPACAGASSAARADERAFAEVTSALVDEIERMPAPSENPYAIGSPENAEYQEGFRLGFAHAVIGGVYSCSARLTPWSKGYKAGQQQGIVHYQLVSARFAPPADGAASAAGATQATDEREDDARSASLFRDAMDLVESAVAAAKPDDEPFAQDEPARRAYRSAYEEGFRLGLAGTASSAWGGSPENDAHAQGWRAGWRAGFRVFFEMQRLLVRRDEPRR